MPETGRDGARAMVAVDLHDEAAAAYEARNELGPQCEHAVLESFVASAAEAIDQRADAGWHSKGSTRPHRSSMTEPAPAGVSGRPSQDRRLELRAADGFPVRGKHPSAGNRRYTRGGDEQRQQNDRYAM